MENVLIYLTYTIVGVILLLMLYSFLVKLLMQERAKKEIKVVMKELEMEKLTLAEAQVKFQEINKLLEYKSNNSEKPKIKFCLIENIFLISSIVLGTLITISSFIWGVI